jgi:beta-lactamase class A
VQRRAFLVGVPAIAGAFLLNACSHLKMSSTHHEPWQTTLEKIDADLRGQFGMTVEQTSVGLLDFKTGGGAMIHPDRIEYAASVAKIGILLAWFHLHQNERIEPQTRHELGLMIKASSNEMAAKFSEQIGLRKIQEIINSYGFYDAAKGGGIWVGKHYGKSDERIPDPVGGNSHAATIRQLVRFYQLLDERKLISGAASEAMTQIFESPEIPHDQIKFVKGLAGRDVKILRKWGSWENWLHDTAIISGPSRRYILAAMTNHPKGDEYLEALAQRIDDEMIHRSTS